MRRVIIESPFAGDVERNRRYLKACILDSLERGEAPFASHEMYTRALDDTNAEQRKHGIAAGFAWREAAKATIVYRDLGISNGMIKGIEDAAIVCNLPYTEHVIEFRSLPAALLAEFLAEDPK